MKALLVDDHWLFLEGMKSVFEKTGLFETVMITDKADVALGWLEVIDIDLILTDVSMPKIDGFSFVKKIKKLKPSQKIIVLTMLNDQDTLLKMKGLGVNGFITKDAELDVLDATLSMVLNNKNKFPTLAVNQYNEKLALDLLLTPTEARMVGEFISNKSTFEIAEEYKISTETVKSHRKNIYRKLDVHNVLELYKLLKEYE